MGGRALILTGTPGTGKTTVARKLREALGGDYLEVGKAVRQEGLNLGFDIERGTLIADIDGLEALVVNRLRRGEGRVLIDTHLPIKIPKRMVEMVVVLRCHPKTLMRRLKRKGYSERKILENAEAEAIDFCLSEFVEIYGRDKLHEIDTTRKKPGRVVEEIRSVLEGRAPRRVEGCRWLDEGGEEERLALLRELERRTL